MRLRNFVALQALLLVLGLGVIGYQYRQRRQLQAHEETALPATTASRPDVPPSAPRASVPEPSPSLEVLRWRAEVSRLRAELDALTPEARAATRESDEWSEVWEGAKPSHQYGFRRFADLIPEGWASPEAAYGSFQHAMRHQTTESLTPARMKEIFDLPDDFDDPRARYSLHLGAGMQGNLGYRVVRSEPLEPGKVKLILEIENTSGSSFREERILVRSGERWRVRPERVERLPDLPPDAVPATGPVRTSSEPVLLP